MFIPHQHIKVTMIKTGNTWPDSFHTSAFLLKINKHCLESLIDKRLHGESSGEVMLDENCLQETQV